MNPLRNRPMIAACGLALIFEVASAQPGSDPVADDPKLVHWQWMRTLRLPQAADGPYVAIPLPAGVLGKSQLESQLDPRDKFGIVTPNEIRDLRITDSKGARVPYVLRVMRTRPKQTDVGAVRQFDSGASPKSRAYQVKLELAPAPAPGHNEIEVHTAGNDYRRRVEVFGDTTERFEDPISLLKKNSYVVHYEVDGKTVSVNRFHYDFKQFRFMQVRVHPDPSNPDDHPTITSTVVRRSVDVPGEYVTEPANLEGDKDPVRGEGGSATAWLIRLSDRVPCEKLTFQTTSLASERPFRLEVADPNQPRRTVPAEWRWREEGDRRLLDITFPEQIASRFRLVITDFANEQIFFSNVAVTRCVRKMIFEKPDAAKFTPPFRLYYGNQRAQPPGFMDLEKKLPDILVPPPPVVELESETTNPDYQPAPLTLNERMPWLVYLVLGFACLILLAILGALARQAIRRHDQVAIAASSQPDA